MKTEEPGIINVDVAGGRIAAEISGAGTPLVLLHAGVADRTMWQAVVPALETRYTVVTMDFRGFGQSPPPSAAFRHRDDVIAVLDELSIPTAHLVGASMGGTVAMEVALAQPGRVRSLVLLAPGLPGHNYSPQMRDYFVSEEGAVERGDVDAAVELDLEMWVRGPRREWSTRSRWVADQVREAVRICLTNMAQTEQYEQDAEPVVRDSLQLIGVPTVVGIAEADPNDFIEIGDFIGAQIPGARTVRFADTAHLIAMERPEMTVATIVDSAAQSG